MKDGYYWIVWPTGEWEVVRITGKTVNGFWNCESTLDELVSEGAQFNGPIQPSLLWLASLRDVQ